VLHLQDCQVQRGARVDGRVVGAALDAALQVPLGQDPQGAPGRRTLQSTVRLDQVFPITDQSSTSQLGHHSWWDIAALLRTTLLSGCL